jgi:hypothetical protein
MMMPGCSVAVESPSGLGAGKEEGTVKGRWKARWEWKWKWKQARAPRGIRFSHPLFCTASFRTGLGKL